MSQINLGAGLSFDLGKLIRTRMLIAASSGGGKSWTLRRLLEQTFGKVQQIVLDYEGEFSTLREKFDYVLVGKGGEVAADARFAPQLARRLMELHASAIIDLYELGPEERKQYVKVFLDSLINLPKELWHPCLVVVDEAHVFDPEKGKGESVASDAVKSLTTRGRKRGYCAVLATQNIAKLNKDSTGECRNRLIGLAVEDITRKRSAEELGMTDKKEILALRDMEPGEFYAFGPAFGKVVKRFTVGAVQTSHPEIGTKWGKGKWAAPPPPREKVKAILSKLEDLPKEADEEVNTVAALRREVMGLKKQLRERILPPEPRKAQTQRIEVPILRDSQIARLERAFDRLERTQKSAHAIEATLTAVVDGLRASIKTTRDQTVGQLVLGTGGGLGVSIPSRYETVRPPGIKNLRPPMGREQGHEREIPTPSNGEIKVSQPERKILTALATYPQGRTITQVALLTGYARNGGAFRNPLGSLRSKGFIQGRDTLSITEAGRAALGDFAPLPEPGPALLAHWKSQLSRPENEILSALADSWPESLSVPDLAARTVNSRGAPYDPDGGAFRNPLGRLRTLELVRSEGPGLVKISDDLMVAG